MIALRLMILFGEMPDAAHVLHWPLAAGGRGRVPDGRGPRHRVFRLLLGADVAGICRWRDESCLYGTSDTADGD